MVEENNLLRDKVIILAKLVIRKNQADAIF